MPVVHTLWVSSPRCRRASPALTITSVPTVTERRLSRLENEIVTIYDVLAEIRQRLDANDARFDAHDERFDRIEARLDQHTALLYTILDLLRGTVDER